MPSVIRHLEVAHQNAVGNGVLSESAAYFLDHILKPFPALQLRCIHKHRKLIRGGVRTKIDGTDSYRTDFASPMVTLLKQPMGGSAYFRG